MDPDVALTRLRGFFRKGEMDEITFAEWDDIVPVFDGLDEWLSKGGYLPSDWANSRVNYKG